MSWGRVDTRPPEGSSKAGGHGAAAAGGGLGKGGGPELKERGVAASRRELMGPCTGVGLRGASVQQLSWSLTDA